MFRLAYLLVALASAASGCTMSADNRPHTVQYITEAILAPSCGTAQCHSQLTASYTDIFDTVDNARNTIVNNGLVRLGGKGVRDDRMAPEGANLVVVVSN